MGHPADLPPSFSLRMTLIPTLVWPANEGRKTHNRDIVPFTVAPLSINKPRLVTLT